MERLEAKKINGRVYYYYSKWQRVKTSSGSRCRRVWQKYLGNLSTIVNAIENSKSKPKYAEVFQWGLTKALWDECQKANIIQQVNSICEKHNRIVSTGEYLAIAAISRAVFSPVGKSMWEWFSQTALMRFMPNVKKNNLTFQMFWDHMGMITSESIQCIWEKIIIDIIKRENIDISSDIYDGTNFYNFIKTFNYKTDIAKRGNRQEYNTLHQANYALFCTADGQIPLKYEVYEGIHHTKQFPEMVEKFNRFIEKIGGKQKKITLIFNENSSLDIELLDNHKLHFVGSVNLSEHDSLACIPNNDDRFEELEEIPGTKAFRVEKKVFSKKRTLIVTYNEDLFQLQLQKLQSDINNATSELMEVKQNLEDRLNGIITKGKKPTKNSIEAKCKIILIRQYLKQIFKYTINITKGFPILEYKIDMKAFYQLSKTYLGKNILITSREEWNNSKVIKEYHSQFIIEDVFKAMKDHQDGEWLSFPNSSKIHGLYCTIAVLLRVLLLIKVRNAGIEISMKRMLEELEDIKEIVNIYPKKGEKDEERESILSKPNDIQERLMKVLNLELK